MSNLVIHTDERSIKRLMLRLEAARAYADRLEDRISQIILAETDAVMKQVMGDKR